MTDFTTFRLTPSESRAASALGEQQTEQLKPASELAEGQLGTHVVQASRLDELTSQSLELSTRTIDSSKTDRLCEPYDDMLDSSELDLREDEESAANNIKCLKYVKCPQFFWAAYNDEPVSLRLMLMHDDFDVNEADEDGEPAVAWAISKGNIAAMRCIMEHHATYMGFITNAGLTALDIALEKLHDIYEKELGSERYALYQSIAAELIKHGVDLNHDNQGSRTTAFQQIIQLNDNTLFDLCVYLPECDFYKLNREEQNALHVASSFRYEYGVRKLLENGMLAHINQKDRDGNTPLHLAAENGCSEVAEILLQYGADTEIKNEQGRSPKGQALYRGEYAMHKLIFQAKSIK